MFLKLSIFDESSGFNPKYVNMALVTHMYPVCQNDQGRGTELCLVGGEILLSADTLSAILTVVG